MTAQGPGEAVANADAHSSYAQGMCLQFVRGPCWEIGSFYGSAIEAWNGAAKKHPGDRNPPKGAPMFYRGGSYGHIVISRGSGRMRSTDCTYATAVNNADLNWPEHAWGDDYLGWTEDLNGVDLPLGLTPPEPLEPEEEMPTHFKLTNPDAQTIPAGEWQRVKFVDPGDPKEQHGNLLDLAGHTYSATFTGTLTPNEMNPDDAIRTRIVNLEQKGDSWEVVSSLGQVEHPVTTGGTYLGDSRNSACAKGRRVGVEVKVANGGVLEDARWEVLRF